MPVNPGVISACRGCGQLASWQMQCPALQKVDATFSVELTDAALAGAVVGMPSLTTLMLAVYSTPRLFMLLMCKPEPDTLYACNPDSMHILTRPDDAQEHAEAK